MNEFYGTLPLPEFGTRIMTAFFFYYYYYFYYYCYSRFYCSSHRARKPHFTLSVHNISNASAFYLHTLFFPWLDVTLPLQSSVGIARSGDHDGKNTNSFNVSSTTDSLKVCLHKNPNIDGDNIFVHTDTSANHRRGLSQTLQHLHRLRKPNTQHDTTSPLCVQENTHHTGTGVHCTLTHSLTQSLLHYWLTHQHTPRRNDDNNKHLQKVFSGKASHACR